MLMREPGKCEEILAIKSGDGPDISDCQWDGKHIWLATLQQGLWQLDESGTVMTKVGSAQGLPPCDRRARVVAIGVDKLMIAGAFGPTHRAFLAIVKADKGGYRANVFHKAPRVIGDQRSNSDSTDPDLAFLPQEMALCQARDGAGPFVVVRRQGATRGANSHPLIVDCRTLSVCAAKTRTGPFPFLACAGGVLASSDLEDKLLLLHPTPNGQDLASDFPALRLPRAGTANSWAGAQSDGWAVVDDGAVYLMGNIWFRVDLRTWHVDRLTDAGSPSAALHLGGAGHFGFVAWGNDRSNAFAMYRVSPSVDNRPVK
jgi:hypothetical protein